MLKYIFQFVVSGTVVVLATYIGQHASQKWAGLLVAFPTWTILTYIFLRLNDKSANYHTYLTASVVFMIPAAILILSLLLANHMKLWSVVGIGLVAYAMAALLISKLLS